MADLRVTVDGVELDATWTDENPDTREAIEAALPLEGDAARWGEELYFRTDVDVPAENAREEVPVGTLAYWPQGNAVCLFWGPTPAWRVSTCSRGWMVVRPFDWRAFEFGFRPAARHAKSDRTGANARGTSEWSEATERIGCGAGRCG